MDRSNYDLTTYLPVRPHVEHVAHVNWTRERLGLYVCKLQMTERRIKVVSIIIPGIFIFISAHQELNG